MPLRIVISLIRYLYRTKINYSLLLPTLKTISNTTEAPTTPRTFQLSCSSLKWVSNVVFAAPFFNKRSNKSSNFDYNFEDNKKLFEKTFVYKTV